MTASLIDHSPVEVSGVFFATTPNQSERACYIERRTRTYRVSVVMNTGEMRRFIAPYSPTPNTTGKKALDALRLAADLHIVSTTDGKFTAKPTLASDIQSLRAHFQDDELVPLLPTAIAIQLKPAVPVSTKKAAFA